MWTHLRLLLLSVCVFLAPLSVSAGPRPARKKAAQPAIPDLRVAEAAPSEKAEPPPAPVDPKKDRDDPQAEAIRQQVRALVRDAGAAMDRGDKQTAVSLLRQAQALRPDPSLDYNLGMVYAELGKGPEAAEALSRFLRQARPEAVTRDRLEDVRRRLDAYREQLARLAVKVEVPGPPPAPPAQVVLDGQPAVPAAEAAAPRWLGPGTHELRVSASGKIDFNVSLTLQPGEERSITAQLAPRPQDRRPLVPVVEVSHGPPPFYARWWFWAAIGGTVIAVGLIGAGAAGRFNHPAPGTDLDSLDVAR